MASGVSKLCCLGGLRSNLAVSLFLAKDVVQAVLPGYSSLRPSSFIAPGPSFLR